MTPPEHTAPAPRGGLPWIHRRPRLHPNINRAVVITLILFAIGQIVVRTVELPMGWSLIRFVTYGMIVYVTIMGLLWLTLCSRFSRQTVWTVTTLVLVAIGGAASMIRSWSWTGDSWLAFEWRWQKTADQRLEEYQKGQSRDSQSAPRSAIEPIAPEDMPAYRGVNRDGYVVGPPVREDWSATPPEILWKHEVGGGFAQPVVVGNYLVNIEQRRDNEVVALYDAATGNERWTYTTPGKFDAMGGPGPRATPVIHDGKVYALGALGHLACLDLASGAKIWSRELLGDFGVSNQTWGITSSPLVHRDWLIVNVGGFYGGGLVALKLADGTDVWKSEGIGAREGQPPAVAAPQLKKAGDLPDATDGDHAVPQTGARNLAGYAAPIIVTIVGVPQILNYDGIGLWGHAIEDGRILWFHLFQNTPAVNVAQPIHLPDDQILISASYGKGSRLLQIKKDGDQWSASKIWEDLKSLESKMSSPVLIDGHVYGLDEGFLTSIDPATGKQTWKKSRAAQFGHGQLLVNNGLLIVLAENGDLVLIRPQPDQLVVLGKFHVLDGEKTWNPPAMVRGKLYVRNHHEMACVDISASVSAKTAEATK